MTFLTAPLKEQLAALCKSEYWEYGLVTLNGMQI
jgi:hypothetical protein